jgi:hypothetical protein
VSIFPAAAAIPADCMSVELKRQLDVAVAKQSLHGFWIGSDTDEKRRETVAQIMKTESLWVVIDQRSSEVRRSSSRSVGSCSANSELLQFFREHVHADVIFFRRIASSLTTISSPARARMRSPKSVSSSSGTFAYQECRVGSCINNRA